MSTDLYKDCLRLSEHERKLLLETLAGASAPAEVQLKRSHDRHAYPGREIMLTIEGRTEEGARRYLTLSRDLSAMGMSLLHGGFAYTGGKCSVSLRTLGGEVVRIGGEVMQCRLVKGRVHELGIRFDAALEPADFVASAAGGSDGGPEGVLVFLDDQQAELLLLEHHLKQTRVTVHTAQTAEAAIGLLSETGADLFVCDLDLGLGVEPGDSVMTIARSAGFSGPMLALTGETSKARLAEVKAAGAASILLKPYDPVSLRHTLVSLLPRAEGADRILSTLRTSTPEAPELLATYLSDLRRRSDELLAAPSGDRFEAIRELVGVMGRTGAGFGYGALGEAAAAAVLALDASASVEESLEQLGAVRDVLSRLEPRLAA